MLVLEMWREVDAVVLADVTDGGGRKLLGLGRDAHGIEDVTTGRQVTSKGSGTDICQSGKFTLADKAVFVVVVDHTLFLDIRT